MTTGKGILLYLGGLFVFFVLIALSTSIQAFPGILAFVGYLAIGFMLNRVVLRGLIEWHPVYNTLENVSSAKLSTMAFWILAYPKLFFQLLVTKHL